MKKVQNANEQIGCAKNQDVIIINYSMRVPGNDKNAECDKNTEKFNRAVKKKIIMMSCFKEE